MKNPSPQFPCHLLLAPVCALLPAAAQAATVAAGEVEPGALLTLAVGLLLLLLRPGARQPAYELFARDMPAHPEPPAPQQAAPYHPPRYPPRITPQPIG